jgi:hypothetical protein
MVSVRLSDEEFEALREFCHATGARSISDLARDALQRLIAEKTKRSAPAPEWLELRMNDLEFRVQRLQEQLAQLAGQSHSAAAGDGPESVLA